MRAVKAAVFCETLDQGPVLALLLSATTLSLVLVEHNKEASASQGDFIELLFRIAIYAREHRCKIGHGEF